MQCAECHRLLAEHERRKANLALARQQFREGVFLTPVEYQSRLGAANKAFLDLEFARLELEEHRRVHAEAN